MQIKEELLDIEGIKNSNKQLIDLFIRRTAVLTSTSEDLTEKIIKDQWRRANKTASSNTNVAEIDFCNLGSFFISKNKAKNKIIRLEKKLTEVDETRKDEIKQQIRNIKIKTKNNED